MDKQTQDLSWACLPKEARMAARETYRLADREYKFHYGKHHAFETMFGKHNLTSDTEPEEMLMVERKKVQDLYFSYQKARKTKSTLDKALFDGRLDMLDDLFARSFLPDEELNEDNFAKSEPSVQVEPKFRKGDRVRVISNDKYGVISRIVKVDEEDDGFFYTLDGVRDWRFAECNLEPYTEPKSRNLSQFIAKYRKLR